MQRSQKQAVGYAGDIRDAATSIAGSNPESAEALHRIQLLTDQVSAVFDESLRLGSMKRSSLNDAEVEMALSLTEETDRVVETSDEVTTQSSNEGA